MISLHLLVRNEIALLPKLLSEVRPLVEEVVIVDTGSTDGTFELAKQTTPLVVSTLLNYDFGGCRNKGLELVSEPWVLWLDADELPNEHMKNYLIGFKRANPQLVEGVRFVRHNLIDGRTIGDRTVEKHVRLFRKRFRFSGRIHEVLNIQGAKVIDAPGECAIRHYKTGARQAEQNERYMAWPEQRAVMGL